MSKQNNRIIPTNRDKKICRKCGYHVCSDHYVANLNKHHEIIKNHNDKINRVNMNDIINIKLLFHILLPRDSFNKDKVISRTHDIVCSLNDDFNNYSSNTNTMNNSKYKNIIKQIFGANTIKQGIYLSSDYQKIIPEKSSNIVFELGEIYYYPVKHKLNLSKYDDISDVESQRHEIEQYVRSSEAGAYEPKKFVNILSLIHISEPTRPY